MVFVPAAPTAAGSLFAAAVSAAAVAASASPPPSLSGTSSPVPSAAYQSQIVQLIIPRRSPYFTTRTQLSAEPFNWCLSFGGQPMAIPFSLQKFSKIWLMNSPPPSALSLFTFTPSCLSKNLIRSITVLLTVSASLLLCVLTNMAPPNGSLTTTPYSNCAVGFNSHVEGVHMQYFPWCTSMI